MRFPEIMETQDLAWVLPFGGYRFDCSFTLDINFFIKTVTELGDDFKVLITLSIGKLLSRHRELEMFSA